MNPRDSGIAEQKLDEFANHLRAESLTEAALIGEELVDFADWHTFDQAQAQSKTPLRTALIAAV